MASAHGQPAGIVHAAEVEGAVDVRHPSGARLLAPAGTIPSGRLTIETLQVPPEFPDLFATVPVEVSSSGGQPTGPVELRFPVVDPPWPGARQRVAVFDEDLGLWIPLPTEMDGNEVVALIDSFSAKASIWDRIVDATGSSASWLQYQGGRLLGNRADHPRCGASPAWLQQLITVEDDNAELFACGEAAGGLLAVKLVNNRGYPVTVEFDQRFARAAGLPLPRDLSELVQRATNRSPSESRVFLTAQGQATVYFSRPVEPAAAHVQGWARRDPATFLTQMALDLSRDLGADVPLGGGRTLGLSSVDCMLETYGAVETAAGALVHRDPGATADVVEKFRECMQEVVDRELDIVGGTVQGSDLSAGTVGNLSKLSKFLRYLDVADYAMDLADILINDASAEADLVDIGIRMAVGDAPAEPDIANAAVLGGAGPVMLVVDTSGSMGDADASGLVKIEGAKGALLDFLDSAELDAPLGLWTYPASAGGDCGEGREGFPLAPRDPAEMSAFIRTLTADGDTPTAEALLAAGRHIRAAGFDQATIVLVSDGESTCEPPCDAARQLLADGLAVEVIGVGFDTSPEGQQELDCIADVTGGASISAADTSGLESALADASRPTLRIELEFPNEVVAEVGYGSEGTVQVSATVVNTSTTEARNVVVRLAFDGRSPGVAGPVRALGNVAPEGRLSTSWSFRPSLAFAGTSIDFAVTAGATNTAQDVRQTGAVSVVDTLTRADAGPILDGDIAILGDSYSSGEGADAYLEGTDSAANSCHHSLRTYLSGSFGVPHDHILACSGAVIAHLTAPDTDNNIESQQAQLQALSNGPAGPPDVVALTIGGNDVGFRPVAEACLLGFFACDNIIGDITAAGYLTREFTPAFVAELVSGYTAIHRTLNSEDAVERRGSVAPILIPAYPRPVPYTDRACLSLALITQGELDFITRFIARLNGHIEAATKAARTSGVPVFFVPTTEDAFLPDHTICDKEPYARSIERINGAGVDTGRFVSTLLRHGRAAALALTTWNVLERSVQELFHPNQDGYLAMTRAILRWSRGSAAADALEFTATVPPAEPARLQTWDVSAVDLGQLQGGGMVQLQPGVLHPLTVGGFAPGSAVQILIESDPTTLGVTIAEADGGVYTAVAIPADLAPGPHTVRVVGTGPDEHSKIVELRVVVQGSSDVPVAPLMLAAAAALLVVAGLAAAAGRWTHRPGRRVAATGP
jgi:hypothetical protein